MRDAFTKKCIFYKAEADRSRCRADEGAEEGALGSAGSGGRRETLSYKHM